MTSQRKLLVIDDKPAIRYMVSEYFKKRGWEVYEASSGEESVKKLAELMPDCVILDIQLVDMDGFEVCRHIRANENLRRSAVIMITGSYRRDEDKMKGLSLGADAYILKPFQLKDLEAQVSATLKAKG